MKQMSSFTYLGSAACYSTGQLVAYKNMETLILTQMLSGPVYLVITAYYRNEVKQS